VITVVSESLAAARRYRRRDEPRRFARPPPTTSTPWTGSVPPVRGARGRSVLAGARHSRADREITSAPVRFGVRGWMNAARSGKLGIQARHHRSGLAVPAPCYRSRGRHDRASTIRCLRNGSSASLRSAAAIGGAFCQTKNHALAVRDLSGNRKVASPRLAQRRRRFTTVMPKLRNREHCTVTRRREAAHTLVLTLNRVST